MIPKEYNEQVDRLKRTFGEKHFPADRYNLIWVATKEFPVEWFSRLVDQMIAGMRQAPMPADFIEAAREQKFRDHEKRKKNETPSFNDWATKFTRDDERMMAQMIIKRLQGTVSDDDWNNFQRMLDDLAAAERKNKTGTRTISLPYVD